MSSCHCRGALRGRIRTRGPPAAGPHALRLLRRLAPRGRRRGRGWATGAARAAAAAARGRGGRGHGPGRHGQPVRPQEAEPGHRARQGGAGKSRARGDGAQTGAGLPAPGRACRSAGRASRSRVAAPDCGRRASRAPRRCRWRAAGDPCEGRRRRGVGGGAEGRSHTWSAGERAPHDLGPGRGGPVPPGDPPRGRGSRPQPRRGVEIPAAPASPGSASLLVPLRRPGPARVLGCQHPALLFPWCCCSCCRFGGAAGGKLVSVGGTNYDGLSETACRD